MYLKSLTLHGFKSFADKTHFEFHKGVTGIVGPNGCGKSNVVDAIRWVLGETSAKALRGDEMADVIFNGTDKRKPVGLAEVTLTMADCEQSLNVDFNEVALTRRVFRDGRSEYRLNNTVCRLKDIHDLIAGTGIGRAAYSIMAQGQIDMLLSSKPEDRRTVFEEAAGITKFKSQKREALRKLEYTEANLLRVADIIAEVKRQMGTLQRQAAKARRYQALLEDTRLLDTHLAHKQYTEFSGEKSEAENTVRMMTQQIEELQRKLQTAETEAAQTREAYHSLESQISQARQQAQELRSQMQNAEGRIGFNRERNEELEGRLRQNEEQIAANEELLDQARRDLVNADEQLLAIAENIQTRQMAVNEHASQHQNILPERNRLESDRRAIRESIRQFEGQIAASEARAQSLSNQISGDRQRFESLSHDRMTAQQARETSQIEFDELQRNIQELEETRNQLEEKAKDCAREIIERRRQRDALSNELNELQRSLTQRKSRLEIIEQLLQKGEGLSAGTQKVISGLDNPEVYSVGVRGLLASSIEVEPAFITPIEAALKDHLQAVLLTESELAAQIIDRLTDHKMGRAALVPHDFCNLRNAADRELLPAGAITWATDKVRVKTGVQSLLDHLLHNVVIVDDLHTALRMKREMPHLAIATMRGEFITHDGIISGGATKEEGSSTLRREAEVRQLRSEVEALEYQYMEKEDAVNTASTQLEEMQREEVSLREQAQRAREGFSQFQGKMSVVQRALQQATAKLESVEWDQNQIQERMSGSESQIQQLREAVVIAQEQLETSRIREAELETEMESFLRRELESSERLNELRTALALEQSALQSIERQKAPLAMRLQELQAGINRFAEEMNTWRMRIQQNEAESARFEEQIQSQRGTIAAIEEHLQSKTEERAGLFEQVSQLEAQLTQLRQSFNGLNESRNRAEVTLTRVDLRLENLISQVQERYSFHIEAFEPDYHVLMLTIEEQKKNRNRGKKGASSAADSSSQNEGAEAVADDSAEPEAAAEEVEETQVRAVSNRDDDAVDIDDVVIPGQEAEPDWAFVMEVVYELRQKLEGIGPVNLDAIQEFEELEERHNFLDTQHNDLVKSKEELLQVIAKINDTTKTMFVETFEQVRGFFNNNFRELFGPAAKADLMLVDENDPLESGIEIIAKPPGKKLQTISLLSGGERSMTAVALLFSIYQVKPSPFCVLDELDAPLDETNIGRFLKMLDSFIDNSQFIIVTHNKRTMSRADVIYGVTMQEFGVSKPVGVRMTTEDTRTLAKSAQELALEAPNQNKRKKKGADADEAEVAAEGESAAEAPEANAPIQEDLDQEQARLTAIEEQEEQTPAVLV
ncbi:chromosome segregation protein SMC [Prosthecobacter vanneervenii]|uniref:Chromosome partition protein Smc n=1 Tax=Prosthecobacter vanneervenii TaxID=48466 RepID=A0A7W7YB78_9BACT|nr:chromosome segregation protein SMC [Prosthecobacter vanneervenii]MBB5033007.1 chromosome segregation protein [Prosthecobacter vanneervenii]